jgi:hypothetical protein
MVERSPLPPTPDRREARRLSTIASGYAKKPFWIPLAGLIMVLSPFGNYLLALRAAGAENWATPAAWLEFVPEIDPVAAGVMGLVFVAGLGLFTARRWSWALASFSLLATVVYNIVSLQDLLWLGSFQVAAMCAMTGFGLLFLYMGWFRRPYLDPRVRWWETSPRMRTYLPVSIRGLGLRGSLLDVSRTGALVEWSETGPVEAPKNFLLKMPGDFEIKCELARKTARGAGLRFVDVDGATRDSLQELLKRLSR